MRAYFINLDRAVERRDRMIALLEERGVDYQRVPAVDVRSERQLILESFDDYDGSVSTDVEMACVLSHIRAWEQFVASGQPAGLFMEDDLHFAPSFNQVMAELTIPADMLAIWRLETFQATVTADRIPVQRLSAAGVYEIYTNHAGAAAYAMSRAMAEHLLSERRRFRQVIDTELFDPTRRSISPVRVLQCIPAPCVQDTELNGRPTAPFLGSSLGQDRHDVRAGISRTEPPVLRLVKIAARPFYRTALSCLLAREGKQRVHVRYG